MANEFKAGVGSVDISPDEPARMTIIGVPRQGPAKGVVDSLRLRANAIAFELGNERCVVASVDTLFLLPALEKQVRDALAGTNLILVSTHCHSADGSPADAKDPECVKAVARYEDKIVRAVVDACRTAIASLKPAELAVGRATLSEVVGESRRMQFSTGACIPAWGAGPVAIPGQRFLGVTEPQRVTELSFLSVRAAGSADPFGLLVSYDSHIHLTGTPWFNAEVPGGLRQFLASKIPSLTCVYALGTPGEISIQCFQPNPRSTDDDLAWNNQAATIAGERIGRALVDGLRNAKYTSPIRMKFSAIDEMQPDPTRKRRPFMLHALAIDDRAILSLPGEMFAEFGKQLREKSPFRETLLLGYNGSGNLGYIATPIAYEQGGYEAAQPGLPPEVELKMLAENQTSPRFVRARPETGGQIVERAIALLQEIRS